MSKRYVAVIEYAHKRVRGANPEPTKAAALKTASALRRRSWIKGNKVTVEVFNPQDWEVKPLTAQAAIERLEKMRYRG